MSDDGAGPAVVPASPRGDDVPWLDELEQATWRAFLRGSYLLTEALEAALAQHGMRMGEYEILSMVSEAPGRRLRMSALADRVVQSRSRLTHTATRLERLGLVERRRIREDGRGVDLHLTAAGQALLDTMAPIHVASVRAGLVDLMSPGELEVVGEVMRRVIVANRTSPSQGADAF
ncbi:MarR family winged helix-turn-helix transcriptional regulator [Ornithinimicrobium sediminis]|uniref:MarR family winged helix-turn-helix transcriptional regulator n=1 Tax=Ornithinimicrobium sediminis TaxID=2904603 RepID=UPI001E65877D|nr:MarR family transcriptional regulator [Ornithinimicrobium sediminis]MCE0485762.1 MarR family transcriptional regulator [Ornithinimicrobium sediminis]